MLREQFKGRAPRGARGLKSAAYAVMEHIIGRAPRGARGLKYLDLRHEADGGGVGPPAGPVD